MKRVRFWSQDLTEDRVGMMGGYLRHGRWWLSVQPRRAEHHIGAEWIWLHDTSTGVSYTYDPGGDYTHTVHAGLRKALSFWFHWELPFKPNRGFDTRTIKFGAHDGIWHWTIWKDPHSWSRADGWRNSSFNWVDALLGRSAMSSKTVKTALVEVPLPECNYPCKITLTDDMWTRPRSILGIGERSIRRATIEPLPIEGQPTCIPVPGKGENSWDCGDDGIYSLSTPAVTVAEAISAMVKSVMRDRERYGGLGWMP